MKGDAKKAMLKALSQEMRGEMGKGYEEGLKDKLMKVTVASDSPEGVEKGLSKAEEIMKKRIGPMMEEGDMESMSDEEHMEKYGMTHDEMEPEDLVGEELDEEVMEPDYDDESPLEEIAEEEAEEELQSPDEIKQMIAELQEKLAMMGE